MGGSCCIALIFGALLGLSRRWSERVVGVVLAFGAGALISAVSFDLAEEGIRLGGADSVAIGLAVGALTYYSADRLIERPGHLRGHAPGRPSDASRARHASTSSR